MTKGAFMKSRESLTNRHLLYGSSQQDPQIEQSGTYNLSSKQWEESGPLKLFVQ